MIIGVRVFGVLSTRFGGTNVEIELPEGATLRDLLDAIDLRWGAALAPEFWAPVDKRFMGGVLLMSEGKDLTEESTRLAHGQKIMLLMPVSGG